MQDADDTKKMIEGAGAECLLLAEDLSTGEATCKKVIDAVRQRGLQK